MNSSSGLRALGIGAFFATAASLAQAAPQVTIFDVPDASHRPGLGTTVNSLNSLGDIVGYYGTKRGFRGFIRSSVGEFTTFDAARKADTYAFAVDSNGDSAGWYIPNGTNAAHGFVRGADGHVTRFDPPGATGLLGTEPYLISDRGTVSGIFGDVGGAVHGFLRASDGTFTIIDAPGAGTGVNQGTWITNINAKDDTTGYTVDDGFVLHGFVRTAGGRIKSFDIAGSTGTSPEAISVKGAVTGFYTDDNGAWHGFLRAIDGGVTTFDAPNAGADAGQGTTGYGLNRHGFMTGFTIDSNYALHGFLRTRIGTIVPVDVDGAGTGGNEGTLVQAVNESGEAAGYMIDRHHVGHGFFLTGH